jgi:hypothetical protein
MLGVLTSRYAEVMTLAHPQSFNSGDGIASLPRR